MMFKLFWIFLATGATIFLGFFFFKKIKNAIAFYYSLLFTEKNPQTAVSYFFRGQIYQRLKQYQKALADYTQAITIDPQYAVGYQFRGNIYEELKEYQMAIADYDRAILIAPQNTNHYSRATVYQQLKDYQMAIVDYSQTIAINSQYAEAYENRGVCKHALGDIIGGIEDLQTAAELYRQQENTTKYQTTCERLKQFQDR